MDFITLSVNLGEGKKIVNLPNVPKSCNLLQSLHDAGIYMPAICGGRGTCGKCKIKVLKGNIEPSKADRAYFSLEDLDNGFRLSCTAYPDSDLAIELPNVDEGKFSAVSYFKPMNNLADSIYMEKTEICKINLSFARQIISNRQDVSFPLTVLHECSEIVNSNTNVAYTYWDDKKIVHITKEPINLYGIAIDIGTTTIGFILVDLQTGEIANQFTVVNKQREYGADVITRIQKAIDGDLQLLSSIVKTQIAEGILQLCKDCGIETKYLLKIAIAGNTTMIHLLLGLSCNTLGMAPFTPVTLDLISINYNELFPSLGSEYKINAVVDILPGLSTYVGSDITAGILYTELHKSDKPAFLLDIGTNGEMVISLNGKLKCTSTAAGPAFEGGNISCGTGSVQGAISNVKYKDGEFKFSTIGDIPPIGICGSGVIDIVYESLLNSLILKTGRFDKSVPEREIILASTIDGQDIKFTQKDVRELQLGKSAIRSGIDALLNFAKINYNDLGTIYIAGGFGYKLNFKSGVGIGLIPEDLQGKISVIGNSSLGGAVKYLLNLKCRQELRNIISSADEFSLSEDKYFNEMFIQNMNFK